MRNVFSDDSAVGRPRENRREIVDVVDVDEHVGVGEEGRLTRVRGAHRQVHEPGVAQAFGRRS